MDPMRQLPRSAGYTLIELMATVALLAVLVTITLPVVMTAVQRREVFNAASGVQDLIEFAKTQASARNLAYQVRWNLGTDGLPVFHVDEGIGTACLNFDSPTAHPDLRRIIFGEGEPQKIGNSVTAWDSFPTIQMLNPPVLPAGLTSLCIKPDGRVLDSTGMPVQATGDPNYGAGDAQMRFQRFADGLLGNVEGPVNVVVVPYNGATSIVFQ
jgi:prepilin-type N-terminal cleavage/methylation domain-containing protein